MELFIHYSITVHSTTSVQQQYNSTVQLYTVHCTLSYTVHNYIIHISTPDQFLFWVLLMQARCKKPNCLVRRRECSLVECSEQLKSMGVCV